MPHLLLILVILAGPAEPDRLFAKDPKTQLQGWLMRTGKLAGKVDLERLEQTLTSGEAVYLDGGSRSAAAFFGALTLDPAFWELAKTPAHDNIRYDLAGTLILEGAYGMARNILVDLLKREPASAFRAPAFRKLTDLTLQSEQFEQSLTLLGNLPKNLTRDENDEVSYLRGKALMSLGFTKEAQSALEAVSRHSRFRAAALYLLGVLALESGQTEQAESRFCSIVSQPAGDPGKFTFFVSDKTLAIVDHAWLALARIRHDREEHQRALDSYRRIGPESPVYEVANYESAWSLFRLGRFLGARRILEELLENNPSMIDWPSARLLMGYSLLSDCLFEEAKLVFSNLEKSLGSAANVSPAEVVSAVPERHREKTARRLVARIDEASRRILFLRAMLMRLASSMPQKPRPLPGGSLALDLERDLSRARGLSQMLSRLQASAPPSQIPEIQQLQAQVSQATARAWYASKKLQAGMLTLPASDTTLVRDQDLPRGYLTAEEQELARLGTTLIQQQNGALKISNAVHRIWNSRVANMAAGWLRAAHIGQVDAVLGKKQALEIEVQNLAQGRYPLSLFTELARSGLIDDSMEYWPYDGEDWPDEAQ